MLTEKEQRILAESILPMKHEGHLNPEFLKMTDEEFVEHLMQVFRESRRKIEAESRNGEA